MAHTKAQKAAKGNKDSVSKRRGVKIYGGQSAEPGNIIVRQKGTKVWPGLGTMLCHDFTIMATKSGKVQFLEKRGKQIVNVV